MKRRKPIAVQPRSNATAKAAGMAAEQIDKLADASASEEERHSRKRRLIKGPKEFREIRGRMIRKSR